MASEALRPCVEVGWQPRSHLCHTTPGVLPPQEGRQVSDGAVGSRTTLPHYHITCTCHSSSIGLFQTGDRISFHASSMLLRKSACLAVAKEAGG